nr:uncharacterized protein LOC113691753 [Coffea arabica]XP_027066585.1 uncharacterized protein LOC113691753 [Coffea arabica]
MAFSLSLCLRWSKSEISIGEFPRAVGHQIGFLILRVRHGRCTVHAVKLHRLVIVSSNTIKSKLQVLKHIAVVSQDCQACLLAAINSSAVMMAIKLILPPILVDIAHLFM